MWRTRTFAAISTADEHNPEKWMQFWRDLQKNPVATVELVAVVATGMTYYLLLSNYHSLFATCILLTT